MLETLSLSCIYYTFSPLPGYEVYIEIMVTDKYIILTRVYKTWLLNCVGPRLVVLYTKPNITFNL